MTLHTFSALRLPFVPLCLATPGAGYTAIQATSKTNTPSADFDTPLLPTPAPDCDCDEPAAPGPDGIAGDPGAADADDGSGAGDPNGGRTGPRIDVVSGPSSEVEVPLGLALAGMMAVTVWVRSEREEGEEGEDMMEEGEAEGSCAWWMVGSSVGSG